jgi:hypothetical protein
MVLLVNKHVHQEKYYKMVYVYVQEDNLKKMADVLTHHHVNKDLNGMEIHVKKLFVILVLHTIILVVVVKLQLINVQLELIGMVLDVFI